MRPATAAPILLGTLVLAATAGAQVTTETQIQTRRDDSRRDDARFETTIRRDTVIPVVFNETIDAGRAKIGDRFSARVDGGRDLPKGTRMAGRIDRISKQNGQTVLTMRFDEVRMDGGDRYAIEALPVPLNADYLRTQPDGRIKASRNDRGRETKVLGGLLGGLVVGSIFGKAKEGAILGTILGAGAAVLDKESGREIAIKKGARYGAMFERDANLTFADRLPAEDPYDAIRNPGNRDDRDDRRDDRDRDRDRDREEERDRDAERRDRPRLFKGGKEVAFGELRPVRRDGTLWLPVREAARVLDLTFTDESRTDEQGDRQGLYTLEGNDRILELDEERARVRLDGKRQDDLKPLKIGDALYLPVSAFSPLVQETLTDEGSTEDDGA